jgi:hypothetical protein
MLGYTYVDPTTNQTITVQYGPGEPKQIEVLKPNEYITCMYSNQPYQSNRGEWYVFVITDIVKNDSRTVSVSGSPTQIPRQYDDPGFYRSTGSTSRAWNIYHPQTHITDFIWKVDMSDSANANANSNAKDAVSGDTYRNARLTDIVNAPLPIKCKIIGMAYTTKDAHISQIDCIYPGWTVRYGSRDFDQNKRTTIKFESDEYLVSMQAVTVSTARPMHKEIKPFCSRFGGFGPWKDICNKQPSAPNPADNRFRGAAYVITLWRTDDTTRQINLSSTVHVNNPNNTNHYNTYSPTTHIVKLMWDSDPGSKVGNMTTPDTDVIPNNDTYLIQYLNDMQEFNFKANQRNIHNIKRKLNRNGVNTEFFNHDDPTLAKQFEQQLHQFIEVISNDFNIEESFHTIREGNRSLDAYDTVVNNTALDPSKISEIDSIQKLKNIGVNTVDQAKKVKPYFQYVDMMSDFGIPYNKFDDFKSRVYFMQSNISPDDMAKKIDKLKSFGIPNYTEFISSYQFIHDTVGINYNLMAMLGNLEAFGITSITQLSDFLSQLNPVIHLNTKHDFNAWIQLCATQYGMNSSRCINVMPVLAEFNIMYDDMCNSPDFAYLLAFGIHRADDVYGDQSNVSLDEWLKKITLPSAAQIGTQITLQQYIGSFLAIQIHVDDYRKYQHLLSRYTMQTQTYFHVNMFLLSFTIKDWDTISRVVDIVFGTLQIPVNDLHEFSKLMHGFMNTSFDSANYFNYQTSNDPPMLKLTTILSILVQYNITYSHGQNNRLYNLFRFFNRTQVNYTKMKDLVQPLLLKLYNYDDTLSDLETIDRETYLTTLKQNKSAIYDLLQINIPDSYKPIQMRDIDPLYRYVNNDNADTYEDLFYPIVLSFIPDVIYTELQSNASLTAIQSFSDKDYATMLNLMNEYITTRIYPSTGGDSNPQIEIPTLVKYVMCAEICTCFPVVTRISLQQYLQKWSDETNQALVCHHKNPSNYRQTHYHLSDRSTIVPHQQKLYKKYC